MELVERGSALQTLQQRLRATAETGHVVFVAGEAGVGKTSVLRAFGATHANVWWGACDALQTPHPLAPLLDMARDADVHFAARLAGPRSALFEAVLDDLRQPLTPVLMVIEDAHWADDATLDLIKFLGRRIERTRALLVVSFRDDEVPAGHPLRRVIGELPRTALTRIQLPRLSAAGVETLARRALRSPAGLFEATQGNPFFVTELLRHGLQEVPRTVQDLVQARFARLDKSAQAIVRLVSIVPGRLERWLLEALLAPTLPALEACLDSGLLISDTTSFSFRHELARVAVEAALAPPVAQSLHAQVLRAVAADGRPMPAARLAHHSVLADDSAAVRRYATVAADEARKRGANREAARHLRNALRQPAVAGDDQRRRWLEAYALDSANVDSTSDAIAARQELDALYRSGGDVAGEAANLSRLALLYMHMLRNAEADAASRRAIELLESLPASVDLAAAYRVEASLRMLNRDCAESAEWSRKSIALARAFDDKERLCFALGTLGAALLFIDYEAGCRQLEQALEMAIAEELPVAAANAMLNLGSGAGELMQLPAAERWLRAAVAYSVERELDLSAQYCSAWIAGCAVLSGHWDAAAERSNDVLARPTATIARLTALLALGRLRTRRGDPGADEALDEALVLTGSTHTVQRIAPVRAARAEAAFMRGDMDAVAVEAQAALPIALRQQHPWFIGELAFWCWRAGVLDDVPTCCAEPYALQMSGRWREAAAAWGRLGCPFEEARALADGDTDAQAQALAIFERLGARPALESLRRRLHDAGVRGLARGARNSTRKSAYGLTLRELQVLELLCEGLRNAEIAERLCRSVRTVDHHLAAVFAKLGVDSRMAAIQVAQRAGLSAQSGQAPAAI